MLSQIRNFLFFFYSNLKCIYRNLFSKDNFHEIPIYIKYNLNFKFDSSFFYKLLVSISKINKENKYISINLIFKNNVCEFHNYLEKIYSLSYLSGVYFDINYIKGKLPNGFIKSKKFYYYPKYLKIDKNVTFRGDKLSERSMHNFLKNIAFNSKCVVIHEKNNEKFLKIIKELRKLNRKVIFISFYNNMIEAKNLYYSLNFNLSFIEMLSLIKVSDGFAGSESFFQEYAKTTKQKIFRI